MLEAWGVRFIPAREGEHEAGVALKWGADISQRTGDDNTAAGNNNESGPKAAAWDDFAETEPAPPEIEDLRVFWRERPEQWQALHEVSRLALLREMQLDSLGAQGGVT